MDLVPDDPYSGGSQNGPEFLETSIACWARSRHEGHGLAQTEAFLAQTEPLSLFQVPKASKSPALSNIP